MRAAHQPTKISIAKEVMPAKREIKKISTGKRTVAGIWLPDVNNFQDPAENFG